MSTLLLPAGLVSSLSADLATFIAEARALLGPSNDNDSQTLASVDPEPIQLALGMQRALSKPEHLVDTSRHTRSQLAGILALELHNIEDNPIDSGHPHTPAYLLPTIAAHLVNCEKPNPDLKEVYGDRSTVTKLCVRLAQIALRAEP